MNMKKEKYSWNLKPLTKKNFTSQRKKIEATYLSFSKKWQKNNDWKTDPKILKLALDDYEKIQRLYANGSDEGYYYSLLSSLNESDPKIKAQHGKARDFIVKQANEILFFEQELSKLPIANKVSFLASEVLTDYKYFLERCFVRGKYLLSDAEERLLNLKSGVSRDNWINMTSGFLSSSTATIVNENKQKETKVFSELFGLLYSSSKKTRDQSAEAINKILKDNIKVGEAELNSFLENKKIDDELRGVKRFDEIRLVNDCVESEAVDLMLKVVTKNYKIVHRYYQLKAKLLNVKKLAYHERGVPMGEINKSFSYDNCCSLLNKVLGGLNYKYQQIFKAFVNAGQIDVYPKKGKRGGAFCASGLLSMPTYILLNHTDKLNDVLTLAHEVGHGINNELMRKQQNALNFDLSLATAEVASTFFEDFVLKELLKEATDEENFIILMSKLDQDVSTIFRQAALYKFESELNRLFRRQGYLSHQEIGKLFKKHMSAYMGKHVEQSPGSENWWLHWSHIRYEFYVYSYVSGLLISKHMQAQVVKNKAFISKVDYFLSAGLSEKPSKIFANMDININDEKFWQAGINEIEDLLNKTEKLAKKLKKIK